MYVCIYLKWIDEWDIKKKGISGCDADTVCVVGQTKRFSGGQQM